MKKTYLKIVLCALMLTSCAKSTPTLPALSKEQILNTAIASVLQTQSAAVSPLPPTEPPPPATQEPTTTPTTENNFSWNYITSQNSGGVVITIARLVVGERSSFPPEFFAPISAFNDRPVVAELIFIIENTTPSMITVYPDQGKVLAASEQIELFDFALAGANISSSQYSGDLLPGAKLVGGLWFGFQRTSLSEINSMTIFISAPHDSNTYASLGPDYNFVLDLTQRQHAELPPELR